MNDIDKRGANSRWYFRDDRANCGINLIRRNLTHATHVVEDAMPLPHWMPPLGLIEFPEQRNARYAGGGGKMHRPAVMSNKKDCLLHYSRAFARAKASAQIQNLTWPHRGKLCDTGKLVG
jgi:hypothetical protein